MVSMFEGRNCCLCKRVGGLCAEIAGAGADGRMMKLTKEYEENFENGIFRDFPDIFVHRNFKKVKIGGKRGEFFAGCDA